jgi:hypothetical protein
MLCRLKLIVEQKFRAIVRTACWRPPMSCDPQVAVSTSAQFRYLFTYFE